MVVPFEWVGLFCGLLFHQKYMELICPHCTEHVLQHFYPVISVDAAHLKSYYKGMIYIYVGLTGYDDTFSFLA